MKELIRSEPVIFRGLIGALGIAVLNLLTAFGVPLNEVQQAAITGLSVAVLLVFLFLIRAKVTPADLVVAKETKGGVVVAGAAAVQPAGAEVTVADPEVVTAGREALDAEAEQSVLEPEVEADEESTPTRLSDIEDEEPVDDLDDSPAADSDTEGR